MTFPRLLASFKNFAGSITILPAFIFFFFLLMGAEAQNIGIGTPSPAMKLHVSNGDSAVLLLENTQLLNPNISTGLYFRAGNGYMGAVKTIGQNGFEARLGLFTYASEGTSGLIERLSILDNGNVGIGITNPGVKLHVNGALRVDGKISNVADPTDAQDVATKAYVDALLAEIAYLEELIGIGTVTDIEGNIYKTRRIGSQHWMAENLRATKYNDGTPIPNVTENSAWVNLESPGYCWMWNDSAVYADPYGAIYNHFCVADTNSRNVCPDGWHVPSDADWTILTDYLGGTGNAGGRMKEFGLAHWNAPNVAASDDSGFTGLPGGYRHFLGNFNFPGYYGFWWSTTEDYSYDAWYRSLYHEEAHVTVSTWLKQYGCNVRCVKD